MFHGVVFVEFDELSFGYSLRTLTARCVVWLTRDSIAKAAPGRSTVYCGSACLPCQHHVQTALRPRATFTGCLMHGRPQDEADGGLDAVGASGQCAEPLHARQLLQPDPMAVGARRRSAVRSATVPKL